MKKKKQTVMKWEDPPRHGMGGRGFPPIADWFGIAAALKERPGQWALVIRDIDRQHVTRVNMGRNAAFRDGNYQATARNVGMYGNEKNGDLYIRYLGPKDK